MNVIILVRFERICRVGCLTGRQERCWNQFKVDRKLDDSEVNAESSGEVGGKKREFKPYGQFSEEVKYLRSD